jgi:hypothetical protein
MNAQTNATPATFASLPKGQRFTWLSNLGAGDTLEKVSDTEYRNITTRGTVKPLPASIFGPADRVQIK